MVPAGWKAVVERDAVLGLAGFYDEIDDCRGRPNGSLDDAVQPVGEPDEADPVAYLDYRMPALITAQFAPHYDETMPLAGWASAVPWRSTAAVIEPEPRTVNPSRRPHS